MSTLLLISAAIVLPLVLVLTLIAPAGASVESESRSWRLAAKTGSILLLLMSSALFVFGVVAFVQALSHADPWSGMAISLVGLTEGARTAILFFPLASSGAANQRVASYLVRAGGYCLVTLFLFIASFTESWWFLPFAGLSTWFAGMSVYLGRQTEPSSEDGSAGE